MDLIDIMKNLTIDHVDEAEVNQRVLRSKTTEINNVSTEIVYADFSNKTLLIISQYQKVGSMLNVTKDEIHSPLGTSNIFTIKVLFGATGEEQQAAVRYLAEAINITKPLCIFINLKSYSKDTVDKCKDIVLEFKREHQEEEQN